MVVVSYREGVLLGTDEGVFTFRVATTIEEDSESSLSKTEIIKG